MSTVYVGAWVRRSKSRPGHLVESVIAGDAVTRCGKRMADPLEVHPLTPTSPGWPLDWILCRGGCQRA